MARADLSKPGPDEIVDDIVPYVGLFLLSLVAATLLPAQSEAALAGLLLAGYPPAGLIAAASVGNVAGSLVNWLIGRGIERFRGRRWFPVGEGALARASRWYQSYGRWSLLLSWAPIVGDPLTLIAGVLREPLWSFLVLVAVAKVARYLFVAALVLDWS